MKPPFGTPPGDVGILMAAPCIGDDAKHLVGKGTMSPSVTTSSGKRTAGRVRIAGGGIAGLSAAIALAQQGVRAEVHEMKKRVGSSAGPHTEGIRNYLGHDGLQELGDFGIRVEPFALAKRVVRKSPGFVSTVRGLSYYLVARGGAEGTMERQLLAQAQELGVRVVLKSKLSPGEAHIVATGAPRDKVNIVAAGYRFSHDGSNLDPSSILAVYDNEIAPFGYLCVLPGPTTHSVYSCAWHDLRYTELLNRVDRALREEFLADVIGDARLVGKIYGKGYYAPDPFSHCEQGGQLFVGEASGFQDPVGGFGIRFAVISGVLAARAITTGESYTDLVRRQFESELRKGFQERKRLDEATNEFYDDLLRKLGERAAVTDYRAWRKRRLTS
jgi:flavin-dependent dehydrogenase